LKQVPTVLVKVLPGLLYPLVGWIGIVVGWMVLSRFYPPAIIPPVERIGSALQGIVQSDVFFADLFATLFRVIWSFIASLVIGVGLGLAAGVRKAFLGVLHPVMVLAESAPPVAWLVVAILLFGMGHAPSMLVGMSAAIPIFSLTPSRLSRVWTAIFLKWRVPIKCHGYGCFFLSTCRGFFCMQFQRHLHRSALSGGW